MTISGSRINRMPLPLLSRYMVGCCSQHVSEETGVSDMTISGSRINRMPLPLLSRYMVGCCIQHVSEEIQEFQI
ncbi:hypothetical protein M2444_004766 [Paenibacillus sp. PastF-3]|nr:hypothetical protein [Paenibacillus sp. PastF-3]